MDKTEIFRIIKTLSSARAPSGLERARGELFKKELEKIFINKGIEIKTDSLSNYYIKINGKSSKKAIAILAHMDEIGGTI
ncbi:MAG: hypothetical protein ACFFCV_22055, partial [Promethearchaeota archaeon]